MGKNFWVIGGKYADTDFNECLNGAEKRIGPFESYEDAKKEWAAQAWQTIDDATARFRIEEEAEQDDMITYYVVGGIYTDTDFSQPANGGNEQWIGPFDSYEAAKKEWSTQAWKSVDKATARFRIEKRSSADLPAS